MNPAINAATIIDIPRDTEGPGGQKINSYIVNRSDNDLRTMADAVSSVTGAPISYVIRVNFPNFVQMVDEMGGIDINIPAPMNDSFSGAEFSAGPNHLTGDQALAFSRDRHSFSSGDVARTENQGLLIISALQTLRNRNLSAGDTVRLVANLGRHVKLDAVGIGELFRLGQYSLTLDPASIRNVVLPVGGGSGSNLVKTEAAASLLADFVDDGALQISLQDARALRPHRFGRRGRRHRTRSRRRARGMLRRLRRRRVGSRVPRGRLDHRRQRRRVRDRARGQPVDRLHVGRRRRIPT